MKELIIICKREIIMLVMEKDISSNFILILTN